MKERTRMGGNGRPRAGKAPGQASERSPFSSSSWASTLYLAQGSASSRASAVPSIFNMLLEAVEADSKL